ncbi:MAG: hypothetical protein JNK38_00290 [Acidobacteria bacterium]|nr:hypothetical protein [Acidobacteriota bacterium]
MPSVAYQEIVQRIPLLTPEEKVWLAGFLHFGNEKNDDPSHRAAVSAEQNGTEASPIRHVPLRSFNEERQWISHHRDQFRGQFVALAGDRLLAHGADEGEVIDQARLAGFPSPFVTYIETEAEEHYLSGWLTPIL